MLRRNAHRNLHTGSHPVKDSQPKGIQATLALSQPLVVQLLMDLAATCAPVLVEERPRFLAVFESGSYENSCVAQARRKIRTRRVKRNICHDRPSLPEQHPKKHFLPSS